MSDYPLPKFHFIVSWGGARIGFTEVSGLEAESELIEYREGSSSEYSKLRMPGMQKYSNITLKRGTFLGDNDFFEWWKSTRMLGKPERRDLIISLLNEEHDPVMNWKIKNAFPLKVQATDLKADGNEIAIETLELAHEGIEMEAA